MTNRIVELALRMARTYATRDPKEICERLGITVVYAELPATISGFYMELDDGQAVVISDALEPPHDAACMAHELGHALLHKGINTVFLSENTNLVVGKYEREADLFAVSLLVDEEAVRQFNMSTEEISAETGAPLYAVQLWSDYQREHQVRQSDCSND